MALTKKEFTQYIRQFKFRELFNDMGWNKDKTSQPIAVDNLTFTLQGVAEKSGFKILLCSPTADGLIPEYSLRKKIETKVTKLFQEHLIIFYDAKNQEQIWQLVVRQSGKPSRATETRYHISQDPQLLFQRASGIFFELDEEENITIVDVTKRVTENFHQNNEKVTKQFYDKFSKEHVAFIKFIKGIEENINKEWYASLMLNRLMFCYFIQKKGFLDNNKNYLRDKLKASQAKKGKNKFYSFYRSFLMVLFHQGLGSPDHTKAVLEEIGKIPYLNGGLFEEHELETTNPKIDIDDKAFERIFDFFDQYEWHLDTRITATGKDINPDVIGYIFEKYINDRADMGAYYTKEDITDYISKNCVLPFLFDETKRNYAKAFNPDSEIWQMVKTSGDEYIYDAVKKGVSEAIPKEISKGIKDIAARTEWNKPAPPEVALPTEIWREVIDRRTRYSELKDKISKGEITTINDFITYNLNISQFVQDVVESTNDPEFLKEFYKSLNSVTIIDPTCGSGAFLFAAMNILEPLYEACVMRMRAFVEDEDRINKEEKKNFSNKHKFFRGVLENIQNPQHPNLPYFIYKSIILRNLYGVDIMKEAVEIAKLRLFLKLVATVEADHKKSNLGLEPLPDIDFNIRAGNTLIGFATQTELKKGGEYTFDFDMNMRLIEEKCGVVAKTFKQYKEIQLTYGDDYKQFKKAKEELNKRLKELNHELNQLLYKQTPAIKYDKWLETYKPFHWFAEYYEIIHEKGGFDIVIGNPPYVVYNKSSFAYKIGTYLTTSCNNLYAYCIERSYQVLNSNGRFGMIIPNSSISADQMLPLQKIVCNNRVTGVSNYAWRPAKLFEGANMLLAIILTVNENKNQIFSTRYYKWYGEYRSSLLNNIVYKNVSSLVIPGSIPKIPNEIAVSVIHKLKKKTNKTIPSYFLSTPSKHRLFYFRAVLYWIKILTDEPVSKEDGKQTATGEMKPVYFNDNETRDIFVSVLSSSLFFLNYILWSSCQVINSRDFSFAIDLDSMDKSTKKILADLGKRLQKDYQKNSQVVTRNYSSRGRQFKMEKQYFYLKESKPLIDQVDQTLGEYYGFTDEELDFIINYDIKYRMGKELDEVEE
jgi:hypothetical protein